MSPGAVLGLTLSSIAAVLDAAKPHEVQALQSRIAQIQDSDIKSLCESSITEFKKTFLGHVCFSSPAPFHSQVEEALLQPVNIVLESWRESAKSTLANVATLHGALHKRFDSKLITSATGQSAVQRLRAIKVELESNAALRRMYGDHVGGTWSEDEIVLRNGVLIRAKGSGSQLRGDRYDEIDFDDSERDDKDHSDVRTQASRDKYREWIDKVVLNTIRSNGRIRVLYTPIHRQSYWRILADRVTDGDLNGWTYLRFPVVDAQGQSNWPAVWPIERIEAKRRLIGSRAFLQEYMLEPSEDVDTVIKQEWIRWFGAKDDAIPEPPQYVQSHKIITVDSAISQSEAADYASIAVSLRPLSGEHRGRIFFPEVSRGHWTIMQQVEQLFTLEQAYKPDCVGIPKTALEKALKELLLHYYAQKGSQAPPIVEIAEDRDKRRRLMAVEHVFEQGNVWFHRKFCRDAVRELLAFTGSDDEHDDMVDAVASNVSLQIKRAYPEREEELYRNLPRPEYMSSGRPAPYMIGGPQAQGRYMR